MTTKTKESTNEVPLSKRMREQTLDVHDTSDRLVNLKLGIVLASKPLYAEAISLFWPIYREMESLMEIHKDHEHLRLLYPLLPYLRRAPLFEEDINALLLGNKNATEKLKCSRIQMEDGKEKFHPPELQEYIDNLRSLSKEEPVALLAYIFAMYGAIMAGGSIIRRTVKSAFSLKSEKGVELFHVSLEGSGYKNILEFRNAMKRRLDVDMNLPQELQDVILRESPHVFLRNNRLLATVQATPVFQKTWNQCMRYFILISSAVVVILAAYMAYIRTKP